jgi:hypothetical protein
MTDIERLASRVERLELAEMKNCVARVVVWGMALIMVAVAVMLFVAMHSPNGVRP